ncbi:MAG: thioesterase family protein [Phascolarctobacterium sp.]
MSNTLITGLVGTATTTVTTANIAATMKSGSLAVFATPAMCALMEEAACAAVNPHLEAGSGTVGISLNITHDRATAMNDIVTATATLIAVEGRKLVFKVQAEDSKGSIGKGSHERFIINNEKFMAKVNG